MTQETRDERHARYAAEDAAARRGERTETREQRHARYAAEDARVARGALTAARNITPEAAASANELSRRTGIGFEAAVRDDGTLRARADAADTNAILQQSPALSNFLSEPANAAVAGDDAERLENLRRELERNRRNPIDNTARGVASRAVNLAGGLLSSAAEITRSPARTLDEMVPLGGPIIGSPDYVDQMAEGRDVYFRHDFDGFSVAYASSSASMFDPENDLAALGRQLQGVDFGYEPGTTWEQVKDQPLENFLPFAFEQGIVSTPDMAAAIAALPAYITARTGEIAQERAERDAREFATVEDFFAAAPTAAAASMLERLGAKGILGVDDVARSFGDVPGAVADAALTEGGTEFAQEFIETVGTTLGTESGFSFVEALDRGLAGAVSGGVFGGSVRGGTATVQASLNQRNREAVSAAERLEAVRDAAMDTALASRDVETLRAWMGSIKDEEVHIDGRTLLQEENSSEMIEALGLDSAEVERASVEGGDVAVPLARYTTLQDDQMFMDLAQMVRERPDAATLIEANEDIETIVRDYAERATAQEQQAADTRTVSDLIYNQLTTNIGHTPDTARAQADVVAAGISQVALDAGVTPEELYAQVGLRVQRPEQQQQDLELQAALDDLRRGAVPSPVEAYGPSLQEMAVEFGIPLNEGELDLRDEGQLDEFGERATEEGFFAERPDVAAVEDALLGDELRIDENRNVELANRRDLLLKLQEMLDRSGVPLATATVADVQQGLEEGGGGREFSQPARGSITIPSDGVLSDEKVIIRLGEAHDLSTFAHEGAHLFLELYKALAPQSDVVAAKYRRIEEFLGVEPGGEITTEQHELWARTFEAYLREGKAPSIELRGAFQRFKSWLARIYQNLLSIGEIKLNDEARQIFDSILATEAEIAANREAERMELSETYRSLMDEQTIEKYGEAAQAARAEAEERALQVRTEQIAREQQREWREARRQARKEEETNYWAEPENAAFWLLTRGTKKTGETPRHLEGVKLDRAAVEELIGPSAMINQLPRSKGRVYTAKGGADPDLVALHFGFANGHEMLLAMMESRAQGKPEQVISQRADALTRERLGDPRRDGTAERVAREAVYSDKAIQVLRVEQDFLASKALLRAMPSRTIKAAADRIINTRPVKETVKPGTYAIRAQRAADKALRLAAAGKWAEALEMKQTQILNAELARRAFKARDEVVRINRVFRRVRTKKYDTKKFHPRFVEHIKSLLNLFENGEGDRAALEKFADDVNVGQFAGAVLMPVVAAKDPTSMTLDELRDLRDSLLSGEKAGRLNGELAEAELQARGDELSQTVMSEWGSRDVKSHERDPSFWDDVKKQGRKGDAAAIRWPFFMRMLQGGDAGPIVEQFDTKMRAALNAAMRLQYDMDDQYGAILKDNGITQDELGKRLHIPELKDKGEVRFETLLSLAMNMGNEGNRARVEKDPSVNADISRVMEILNENLEKRHWDAVQQTWDLIDTMWPAVSEVERRTTGVAPQKVEAVPFQTPHGEYAGGYYPIAYDTEHPRNSGLRKEEIDDLWKDFQHQSSGSAQTRRGHTKARVDGVARPLDLRLSVALDHFRNASRDIHLREIVDTNWRLLTKTSLASSIEQTYGPEYLSAMETILKRTVVGTERPKNVAERIARGLRVNSAIAILGFKVTTAALAPVSYIQTIAPQYGRRVIMRGLAEFASMDPVQMHRTVNMITEKSTFMRERTQTLNREAHERVRRGPFKSRWSQIQGAGFWMMAYAEIYTTSGPLWMGVYHTQLEQGASEADAIASADRAVATTQGSGLEIDQSVLQGGNEFERYLTFLWGYMSGYYGTVRSDVAKQAGTMRKFIALGKHLIAINLVASMLEAAVRHFGAWDEEDDPYLAKVLKLMGRNTLGLVPGGALLENRYGEGMAMQTALGRIGDTASRYWDLGADFLEDGEVDGEAARAALASTAETAGFAAGMPGVVQLGIIARTLNEDDDPTIFEMLVTGPDDDN